MKRFGVICLGLLCASAVFVPSALANEYPVTALPQVGRCLPSAGGEWVGRACTALARPGKGHYKWEEGAVNKKFSGTGEITTLESANSAHTISCAATIYEGEYESSKTAKMTLDLVGCVLTATRQKCQSSPVPEKEGEIEVSTEAKIGFIKGGTKPVAGWDLTGWNVTVTCGVLPETTIHTDKIEGSVIGAVSKTGKMLTEETLKFSAVGGKQNPEHFEGEPNDVLQSTWEVTGTPEQTGLKSNTEYQNEEELEIKVRCTQARAPCT